MFGRKTKAATPAMPASAADAMKLAGVPVRTVTPAAPALPVLTYPGVYVRARRRR